MEVEQVVASASLVEEVELILRIASSKDLTLIDELLEMKRVGAFEIWCQRDSRHLLLQERRVKSWEH